MTSHALTLSGGTESLSTHLKDYQAAWTAFLVIHRLDVLDSLAVPTTLSWKVADKYSLYANLETLGSSVEQLHIGTVNGRFIASCALHEPYETLWIIKILERRAGTSDRLGLDSIDYIVKDISEIEQLLRGSDAHVERQHNEMHEWLSLRFGKNREFEAKFVDRLIFDISIRELESANQRIQKAISSTATSP